MNKLILITGGTGFVGSHTCIELIKNGYHILIIDSLINSSLIVIDKIKKVLKRTGKNLDDHLTFVKGDLRDKKFLNNLFQEYSDNSQKIEAVIHFAGLKSVVESINFPLKYWDYNVNSTINLLSVMQEFGCFKMVFSSSATIYGSNNQKVLIKENNLIKPINPYGKTKEVVENILNSLGEIKDTKWRIAILRYFNPIGAHNSGLIGESPLQEATNIVPIINKVAAKKINILEIYGNNWDTIDGTCVRDYIHIMDLAEGHLLALESILQNKFKLLKINLGTGKGTSVLQLLDTFQKVNNLKIPYRFSSRRKGDIPFSVADNSLAKSKLNWVPRRDLKTMCIDSWNWTKKNPDGI